MALINFDGLAQNTKQYNNINDPRADFYEELFEIEGGFSNNPNDSGGPTKYGITQKTLSDYLGRQATIDDVKKLTKKDAMDIYDKNYFDEYNIASFPENRLKYNVADFAINAGPAQSITNLQKMLNNYGYNVEVDGVVGNDTLNALNIANKSNEIDKINNSFADQRVSYYGNVAKKDSSQYGFLNGWLNRVDRFRVIPENNQSIASSSLIDFSPVITEKNNSNLLENEIEENPRGLLDSFKDGANALALNAQQGLTLGFGDELAAISNAIYQQSVDLLTGEDRGTFKDYYDAQLNQDRSNLNSLNEELPIISGVGNALGSVATGAAGAARSAAVGAAKVLSAESSPFLSTALNSAAFGGISGAGYSEDSILDNPSGVINDATTGALLGGAVGGALGVPLKVLNARKLRNDNLVDIIQRDPDARIAKYMIDGKGKLAKDKLARKTIKQGFDEGLVTMVKGANQIDKNKFQKMLQIKKRGLKNPTFAAVTRPSDMIGQSVMDRFNIVNEVNKKAAKELTTAAKSLQGQKVNVNSARDAFIDDLDDMGIYFDRGDLDFNASLIEGIDKSQALLSRVVNRLRNTNMNDAYEVHKIKRYLDEQVKIGKSQDGLIGNTEQILKNLRRNLDSELDRNFENYNFVNTVYSETRNALDSLQDSIGKRVDLTSDNVDKRIGTLSRRVLSNAQSRADVMNTFKELDDISRKYGGEFDDDIISQIVFSDELERMFKTNAKTSLQGEREKMMENAAEAVFFPRRASVTVSKQVLDKLRRINREEAFKAMEELLKK